MAHWYQVARTLGRRNPRKSGHFQRVPFRILRQRFQDFLRHLYERRRFRLSPARRFSRDVNHRGAPSGIIVRKLAARWLAAPGVILYRFFLTHIDLLLPAFHSVYWPLHSRSTKNFCSIVIANPCHPERHRPPKAQGKVEGSRQNFHCHAASGSSHEKECYSFSPYKRESSSRAPFIEGALSVAPASGADGQSVRNRSEGTCVSRHSNSFTASPPSPSHPCPASPGPEAPQDSSSPAPPPAYRPIPARAPRRLRDHVARHRASPAETWSNRSSS